MVLVMGKTVTVCEIGQFPSLASTGFFNAIAIVVLKVPAKCERKRCRLECPCSSTDAQFSETRVVRLG